MAQAAYQKAVEKKDKGEFITLHMACPAMHPELKSDPNKWGKEHNKAFDWTVSGCSLAEVNQFGWIRCSKKCGKHAGPFVDWRWNCGKYQARFLKADKQFLMAAVQAVLKDTPPKVTMKWYMTFVNNICKQC